MTLAVEPDRKRAAESEFAALGLGSKSAQRGIVNARPEGRKGDLLLDATFRNSKIAFPVVRQASEIYNNERPHYSLGLLTPAQFLEERQATPRR
jgi:transposase InsO family protein